MADKLQKTLKVQPSVASVGNPVPPNPALAQGLVKAAGFAQDKILSGRKEALEGDIRDLGEEVFAVNNNKEVADASERFERLKKGKSQGILGDTMVNIETEKILKQKIGMNPAFGDELRQEARRILGFDPTGSEIQALFGKGGKNSPSRTSTQAEKEMANATTIANTLGLDVNDVFASIQKAKLGEIMVQNQSSLASIGQGNAKAVFNAALFTLDSHVADATGEILSQIKQGGTVNPEMMQAQLSSAKQRQWVAFRASLTAGKVIPSASDLAGYRKEFDAEWEPVMDMASSGTMQTILERQAASLAAAQSIQGAKVFPGLGVINKAIGQAGVQEYLKLTSNFKDDSQLELFKRMSPSFAAVSDNREQAYTAMFNSYNRVMGIAQGESPDQGMDDATTRTIINTSDEPEVRGRILDNVKRRGASFKSFGDYGQAGVRGRASTDEVQYISERWGVEFEPLVSRIASELKSNPAAQLSVSNGHLSIRSDVTTAAEAAQRGQIASTTSIPSQLAGDIKRLNAMNNLVQNGWGNDVGENKFGFLDRTVNKISSLQADGDLSDGGQDVSLALEAYNKSPTVENLDSLRLVAPDIVREAERRAAERGVQTDGKQ